MEHHLQAVECHLPYWITQCYLLPDTSEHTPPSPQPVSFLSETLLLSCTYQMLKHFCFNWRMFYAFGFASMSNSKSDDICWLIWFSTQPYMKQYNLVPTKGQWCSAAGKVTVGLASHWPCVTGFSGLSTYGLKGYEREMSTQPTPRRGMVDFTFFYIYERLMTVPAVVFDIPDM